MSDSLGDGQGDPTQAQIRLYERWAEGGGAVSIIGEVQGDYKYPEKPGNLVLGPNSNQQQLNLLASRSSINSTHIWPQLGHAGALSHLPISRPKGPSALNIEGLKCEAMTNDEIRSLPTMYAAVALCAKEAGFTGVQIHAGHGFLLSQFLSPLFNHRKDGYGGSVEARFRIIKDVIANVRRAVGSSYPVSIKINSTDRLDGGLTQADAFEVVQMLNNTSIDLIDVSGGTYFPGAKSSSDSASKNEPYFIDFARQAKRSTKIPIMATGGFEKRNQAIDALESGSLDMIGLARAMALDPDIANTWLSKKGGDPDFPVFDLPPQGGVTAWYTMRLTAIAESLERNFNLSPESALQAYEERDVKRCIKWMEKFS